MKTVSSSHNSLKFALPLLLVAVLLMAVAVAYGCITQPSQDNNLNTTNATQNHTSNMSNEVIKDKATCEARGGRWGPIGLSPQEVCVLPASDAGKVCLDSKECEGICEAQLSKDDYERLMKYHIPVLTKGTCSAERTSIGCHAYVENGIVSGILCVD